MVAHFGLSGYRIRTRAEAHRFFTKGRVLSMLWAETLSETSARAFGRGTDNTAITVGRFGQGVYSQIRRFVIVKVNRTEHFFYAWYVFITHWSSRACMVTDTSVAP
jgi:hypothetical protein